MCIVVFSVRDCPVSKRKNVNTEKSCTLYSKPVIFYNKLRLRCISVRRSVCFVVTEVFFIILFYLLSVDKT